MTLALAPSALRRPAYVADTVREIAPGSRPVVLGPEDVVLILGGLERQDDRERFVALLLNARHECTAIETVSIGSLNASIVHPREVFRAAILAGSASIIFAHNHPSGDPEPSDEDISTTDRLVQAGELLGVAVLDHVIIGERGSVSLRQRRVGGL